MKHLPALLALTISLSLPSFAQSPIPAPNGWRAQTKANGATTFTPPDLKAGEKYSVTIYDAAPLNGKTLEAWLRTFAGPVGSKMGQLSAPLQIKMASAQVMSGTGTYLGPDGHNLGVLFAGFCFDGAHISVSRTLYSDGNLFSRYLEDAKRLNVALIKRAQEESPRNQAPPSLAVVPDAVLKHLKPGGALVPGVYGGTLSQHRSTEIIASESLILTLHANGDYDITNAPTGNRTNKHELKGKVLYNPTTGRLNMNPDFNLWNNPDSPGADYCFYGRNDGGQPAIIGERKNWEFDVTTSLVWVRPLADGAAPKIVQAAPKTKGQAQFVTAPGHGVKAAQIQAVVHRYDADFDNNTYINEAFLLLRDGTAFKGLSVPPEMFDFAASRAKQPKSWGKWRKTAQGYEVAWAGGTWQKLPGEVAVSGAAPERLDGHFATGQSDMVSHRFWGVRFGKDGRFSKSERGAVTTGNFGDAAPQVNSTWDDGGSGTVVTGGNGAVTGGVGGATSMKRDPSADREGTYSLSGYTLTLRYNSGRVVRQLFFFRDATRKQLWFEGDTLQLGFGD